MYIQNASELIRNGHTVAERHARRLCLEGAEAALSAVEPSKLMKSKVRLAGRKLIADSNVIDLEKFKKVFVIGGGKAALPMAEALESILADKITAGIVNVLDSQLRTAKGKRRIRLHAATHPLPSIVGQEGVLQMLELVGKPDPGTLVICLISGGGSAMLPLPAEGVDLVEKVEITRRLLHSGATIQELNAVRKHLSATKGGRLAERLYPNRVLSLVISDVVGNRLDSIASGPLYPDPSTFKDAERILKKYGIWKDLTPGAEKELGDGVAGLVPETPKPGSRFFTKVSNVIIGGNDDACDAVTRRLNRLKCRSEVLTTGYEGEARSAGMFMGSVVSYKGRKSRPAGYVAGGETTVSVKGDGRGGRNQEFAIGAAMKIDGNKGIALISLGTDGLDGSTDAAGALVDGSTIERSKAIGRFAEESLLRNDSYTFFESLGDLVMTGPTGTNVNDIAVAVLV